MHFGQGHGLQNHHVQRSLQQFCLIRGQHILL
jgi:hypothetical protein